VSVDGRAFFLLVSVICSTSQGSLGGKKKKKEVNLELNFVQQTTYKRVLWQLSHLDLLESVCSLHILRYISVAVMLKLLKKGEVND